MSENKLPPGQRKTLEASRQFIVDNGYPPTVEQLRIATGLKAVSTVHYHLLALKKKGFVYWNRGEARTLRIIEKESNAQA